MKTIKQLISESSGYELPTKHEVAYHKAYTKAMKSGDMSFKLHPRHADIVHKVNNVKSRALAGAVMNAGMLSGYTQDMASHMKHEPIHAPDVMSAVGSAALMGYAASTLAGRLLRKRSK